MQVVDCKVLHQVTLQNRLLLNISPKPGKTVCLNPHHQRQRHDWGDFVHVAHFSRKAVDKSGYKIVYPEVSPDLLRCH